MRANRLRVLPMLLLIAVMLLGCGKDDGGGGGGGGGGTTDRPPIAYAGSDNDVLVGAPYVLSGSGRDPDGTSITSYAWEIIAAPTGMTISSTTITNPTIMSSSSGSCVLGLIVTSNGVASAQDIVIIRFYINDRPPIADAGADADALTGIDYTLNGSGSDDPDGHVITAYDWTIVSAPAGMISSNLNTATPTLNSPANGDCVMDLVVTANGLTSIRDTVVITFYTADRPPVASAGADASALTGIDYTLNGSGSDDPDGHVITAYDWTIVSAPAGMASSNLNTVTPTLNSPANGDCVMDLVVTANGLTSIRDTVVITFYTADRPPIANAGADASALTGQPYTLSGSGSDPDGHAITDYNWVVISAPAGMISSNLNTATPTLNSPANGDCVLGLVVTANGVTSVQDIVVITFYTADRPPVANAGASASALTGVNYTLNGSGSDPDGDAITAYNWTVVSSPAGMTIVNANTATPTIYSTVNGDCVMTLTVTANSVTSALSVPVVITFTSSGGGSSIYSVTSFGMSQTVVANTPISLACIGNGTSYQLSLGVPSGSAVTPSIVGNTISFTTDPTVGVYNAVCRTGDESVWSAPMETTIGVYNTLGTPTTETMAGSGFIVLPPASATFNQTTGDVVVSIVNLTIRYSVQEVRNDVPMIAGVAVEMRLTCTSSPTRNIVLISQLAVAPWTHYGETTVRCDGSKVAHITPNTTDPAARLAILFPETGTYNVGDIVITPLQ